MEDPSAGGDGVDAVALLDELRAAVVELTVTSSELGETIDQVEMTTSQLWKLVRQLDAEWS